jgi:hypothetical protein
LIGLLTDLLTGQACNSTLPANQSPFSLLIFRTGFSGQMLARRLSKVLSHQYDLNEEDYAALMDIFGVRRTSPEFWAQSDLLHDAYRIAAPVESGVYDINRFENR